MSVIVTGVASHLVAVAPGINWALLRVDTDAGLHGWGECTLEGKDLSVLAAVDELARSLVGERADSIELHWNRWYRMAAWKGAALYSAMSGLEQALWDIRGKELGLPVSELLGGRVRERVHAYTWASASLDAGAIAAQVVEARAAFGFTIFKLDPFDASFTLDRAQLRAAEQRVASVTAAGDDVRVAVEGHQRLYAPAALAAVDVLAEHEPVFYEELVHSDDLDGMRHLRTHTAAPLAAGEKAYTRWGAWPLLRDRLVDYVQPDLCHAGGIGEVRKIAALAETVGVGIVPHNPNGPAGFAATLQVAACAPNVLAIETVHQRFDLLNELLVDPIRVVDGAIAVPERPGLGIEIDEDALARRRGNPDDFPFGDDAAIPLGLR